MTPKKNSERRVDFTKGVASMLIKLFHACYRLGVSHAYESQDDGLCRAHVEKTRAPGVFGTIMDEYASNDLFWQLKLCELATIGKFSASWDKYRRCMGRAFRNYYFVAMEVAQDFYNRGLMDYCEVGPKADMPSFSQKSTHKRVVLTQDGPKGWSIDKWVNMAQTFALQRQCITAQSDAKVKAKHSHYNSFIRGIKNASAVSFDAMT